MAAALQFGRLCVRPDTFVLQNHLSGSFRCRKPFSVRCSSGNEDVDVPLSSMGSDFDAKTFRKNLTRSENYNRKGFGHKEE
uniref:Uncharacterized protein n=1 Tax=Brassica oleracea TaxID=3712 RepID=A0A3P6FLZ8_BRAOL|nr:unnamed protein product [Brassica oleracea]